MDRSDDLPGQGTDPEAALAQHLAKLDMTNLVDADTDPPIGHDETSFQYEKRVDRDLRLGAVIREARENAGISLRELARRAAVTPSRLSRIEAGRTVSPGFDVCEQLAAALGRVPCALRTFLDDEFGIIDEEFSSINDDLWSHFMGLYDQADEAEWEVGRRKFARLAFLYDDPLGQLFEPGTVDNELADLAREILGSLNALTKDRRKLLRSLVADQVALSDLDRRGKHGASFTFTVDIDEGDQ